MIARLTVISSKFSILFTLIYIISTTDQPTLLVKNGAIEHFIWFKEIRQSSPNMFQVHLSQRTEKLILDETMPYYQVFRLVVENSICIFSGKPFELIDKKQDWAKF